MLGTLHADDVHGTDLFVGKFAHKITSIFDALPIRKEWLSFKQNDLPLLKLSSEVLDIAADNNLNKSQTKAVETLRQNAPEEYEKLVESADENGNHCHQIITVLSVIESNEASNHA